MQQKQQQQASQQQQQLAVPQQKQPLETQEYVFVDESADYQNQSFDFKSPESRSLRQQPPKVKCPYNECGRDLHPNSLSSHIRTQRQSTNLKINQSRYLNGVCVDQRNGIFLLRKQWHGVDYPIHCQFMVTRPASIQCSSSICRQYAETSIRSGQSGFLCDHLQSTHFLKPASNSSLSPEKLDFINNTNTVKWLKPETNPQCLALQEKALKENVPFIVQIPWSTSSRFIHFFVFANVKVDHYWSFGNRVTNCHC